MLRSKCRAGLAFRVEKVCSELETFPAAEKVFFRLHVGSGLKHFGSEVEMRLERARKGKNQRC